MAAHAANTVTNATLQELPTCLVELVVIHHRDHAPYSYYGDDLKADLLFEAAIRCSWTSQRGE